MKMSQQVHVLPEKTIEEMRVYYQTYLQTPPPGAYFRAKTKQAVITAYKSGKVLFQGSAPELEAAKWTDTISAKQKAVQNDAAKNIYAPPGRLFTSSHIGSDEAGTGDYFGPMTVAACYVPKEKITVLKEIGIQDSKNLTDQTMQKLSKEIIELDIPYSLLVLNNRKYNQLQKSGWTQGKMKAILHHQAITNVLNKINDQQVDGILIDQFCEPGVYKRHLQSENKQLTKDTYFMTKAESYSIAVAASSILARTSFVQKMEQLGDTIGMELPKGASNQVDRAAARFIKQYGEDRLSSIAKIHFANTKKAYKYL